MNIDHLVYAGPTLEGALSAARSAIGIDAVPGGQHVGRGTRNWLANLGDGTYLEIIGPDPDQPEPEHPRPFGIDDVTAPALVAWAIRSTAIDRDVASAEAAGVDLGPVAEMQRARPDGATLRWRLTTPRGGVQPFVIDWGETPHPTEALPAGPRLLGLRVETAEYDRLTAVMDALGVAVTVVPGEAERLVAMIDVGGGLLELS